MEGGGEPARGRRYLSALTGGLRSRMTATAAAPLAYCAMPNPCRSSPATQPGPAPAATGRPHGGGCGRPAGRRGRGGLRLLGRRGTGSPSVQGTAPAVTPLWAGCHGSVVRNALSVFKMENDLLQGPVLLKRPQEYKGRGPYVQGKVHKNIQSLLTATAAFSVTAVVVGH